MSLTLVTRGHSGDGSGGDVVAAGKRSGGKQRLVASPNRTITFLSAPSHIARSQVRQSHNIVFFSFCINFAFLLGPLDKNRADTNERSAIKKKKKGKKKGRRYFLIAYRVSSSL